MTDATIPLLIAAFSDPGHAGQLLARLRSDQADGACGIVDAATLTRDAAGRFRITNSWCRDADGLFVGGVVGTFIGGLAGPAMATAAGGTVLGGLRGRLQSAPLKFELLAIGDELPPGSSLLVAVVEPGWIHQLGEGPCAGASLLLSYELRASVVDRLNEGGNVAFLFRPFGTPHPVNGTPSAPNSAPDARDGAAHPGDPLHSDEAILVSAATLSDHVLV